MQNFQELNLNKNLNASLVKMKFDTPTPIQIKSIPIILEQKDILASAQTGTGKTAAFCIPMIEMIATKKINRAIILVPTRELAKQVNDVIEKLLFQQSVIKSVCLVGGEPMNKQLRRLKTKPQIVVGTPGRVNDHLKRKSLLLNKVDLLILDEMDRMLDMGFSIQIDEIIKFLPKQKQTLMFSATIAPTIERLSKKYLNNAERVSVAAANATLITIKQEVINLRQEDKYNTLVEQVKTKHGSTLVFVKTKHNAKKLAKNLEKEGFESDSLHGNLRQNKRNQVIAKFRANKIHVLVATDIAARGLDIPHIEHVVNFDLPQQAEDFIHRMGRTGRAGASGTAWSFVTPSDKRKWHEIEKILNPGLKSSSDSKRSGGRRDDYSKKRPFKRGGPRDRFRSDKGGKSSFRDKKKTSFRRDDKKESSFKRSDKKDFSSRKPAEFRSEGKKSKPKNAGYGRKTPSSDRPKRGNGFGNREDRAPSFKPRSSSKEGFAEKGKSDFSEKRKKGSGFHDRKKAGFKKSEGKFPGEKKGSFDRKSKGGKSSVSRKKSGFKPGGKKTFKKKF
ncbi:DEAD/DEAH box helicase [Pelagibacteraceae bacterium]|nr:DEAD/DEAH box helicase [Pelagibacteraceae bacterium]